MRATRRVTDRHGQTSCVNSMLQSLKEESAAQHSLITVHTRTTSRAPAHTIRSTQGGHNEDPKHRVRPSIPSYSVQEDGMHIHSNVT